MPPVSRAASGEAQGGPLQRDGAGAREERGAGRHLREEDEDGRGAVHELLELSEIVELVDVEPDAHAGQHVFQLVLDHRHLVLARLPGVRQEDVPRLAVGQRQVGRLAGADDLERLVALLHNLVDGRQARRGEARDRDHGDAHTPARHPPRLAVVALGLGDDKVEDERDEADGEREAVDEEDAPRARVDAVRQPASGRHKYARS